MEGMDTDIMQDRSRRRICLMLYNFMRTLPRNRFSEDRFTYSATEPCTVASHIWYFANRDDPDFKPSMWDTHRGIKWLAEAMALSLEYLNGDLRQIQETGSFLDEDGELWSGDVLYDLPYNQWLYGIPDMFIELAVMYGHREEPIEEKHGYDLPIPDLPRRGDTGSKPEKGECNEHQRK